MATISELKLDVEELQKLLGTATRPKVKGLLEMEIQKLNIEIIKRTEQQNVESQDEEKQTSESKPVNSKPPTQKLYTKQIDSYAWDQSKNYMKIYLTSMTGIQDLPAENVTSEYSQRAVKLRIQEFEGKNHELRVANLHSDIIPAESYHKIKKDMILVMLKKKDESTWPYMTQKEKKSKDKSKPDENKDPGDSMMDLLKQMYEDGDDDMKRTISKAWHESKNKQPGGDML